MLPNTKLTVTKHNSLIEASYKLTLNEQRLILLCIAQLNPRKILPKDKIFTITSKEFAKMYKLSEKTSYKELENASKSLYERDIKTLDGKYLENFRWVYYVKYHRNEGKVTMRFSPCIVPYLTVLHKRFTCYNLKQIAELKLSYSIRLFEFLTQFNSTGKLLIGLNIFKERLGLKKEYKRFYDLKRRIIDPATKELREKTNLAINWQPIKGTNQKSIEKILFLFNKDE
jgi:plasmid replication initiation protein